MRYRRYAIGMLILSALIIPAWAVPSFADNGAAGSSDRFSVGASPVYQFESGIDGGGDMSVFRLLLRADWDHRTAGPWEYGIGLNYDYYDYSFSGTTDFGGDRPWGSVNTIGIGGKLAYAIDPQWKVFVNPSVEYAGESGADFGDSLIWGGVLGATYKVNPDFLIGAGAGLFSRMHEFKFFPMILVNWKITERLRLTNPMRGGPTGPAGLELSYVLPGGWEVGAGGAYRSFRFRLNDEGFAPEGIVSDRVVPVWARLSKKLAPGFSLDLLAGAMVAGELKTDDRDGNEIVTRDYNTAPFVALSLTGRF